MIKKGSFVKGKHGTGTGSGEKSVPFSFRISKSVSLGSLSTRASDDLTLSALSRRF